MPGCRPQRADLRREHPQGVRQIDPANGEVYTPNAAAYAAKIKALDEPLRQRLAAIPEAQRWLVSSEGRLQLPRPRLRLEELYLWPINADEQGTPKQVKRVIDMVRENKIPVVFSESTISDKPAKQVAKETGARYGGVLYVDCLSAADGPVPTYLKLLEANADSIVTTISSTPNIDSGRKICRDSDAWRDGDLSQRPPALHNASFELGGGTICALVGVNGSGKSTLFKAIMGFVTPSAGRVRIAGLPVRARLKKHLVAYVPQAEDVDWKFPVLVEDVVMMGRYGRMNFLRIPRAVDRRRSRRPARVSMTAFRHRQIGELSGGQKKRVFLARALAQGGRIILLDEPFTGVDVKTEGAIIDLLRELRAEGA